MLPSTGGAIQWKKRDAAHAAPSPNAVDPYRLLCCRPDATGFGMRLDCAVEAKEEGAAARVQRRGLPVAIEGAVF